MSILTYQHFILNPHLNFRRRISGYGFVSVPTCSMHNGRSKGGKGWMGDPESDIPGQLFPKHVQVRYIFFCLDPQWSFKGSNRLDGGPESDIPGQIFPKHVQVKYIYLTIGISLHPFWFCRIK